MSDTRVSAKDRESRGWRIGLFGLLVAGFAVANHAPGLIAVGLLVAIIGGIMWGAGMARRD
jgi:xanthine/uracil/vitamin C permease (AzgA family)